MPAEDASMVRQLVYSMHSVIRFLVMSIPWTIHLLLADVVLSALLPLAYAFPKFTYDLSSRIAESVWKGVQSICVDHNNAKIIISGDTLPQGESAIVIANHVEWSDFYLIQALALKSGMLGRCRWFAKQQLKWVPFLGWGLWAMGMPLVSRNWTEDKREMDHLFHGIIERKSPIWLVSYSEATRYTEKKYAETVIFCQKNGKPIPKNTLYPRTKGFVATVQNLRKSEHVKAVYDVTIAYAKDKHFMTPPSFLQTMYQTNLGQSYTMYVHVRRHEIVDLPMTDGEISKWLESRWMEKGDRLEVLKQQLVQGEVWSRDDYD